MISRRYRAVSVTISMKKNLTCCCRDKKMELYNKNQKVKFALPTTKMFPVTEECKGIFTAIKIKQKHAYAVMKIKDRKEIVLAKTADPLPDFTQETNEKVFDQMKHDILELGEPCYILFDVRFQRRTGFMKDMVGFIFWCPDNISTWDKMIYASSNQLLKAEFKGVKAFEYHDEEDFSFQGMVTELRRKDRQ